MGASYALCFKDRIIGVVTVSAISFNYIPVISFFFLWMWNRAKINSKLM